MWRYERAGLEHELVAVAQRQVARVAAYAQAISEEGDNAVEAQQQPPPERHSPHLEEVAEPHSTVEMHDAGRLGRPFVRTAVRVSYADARRNDDGEAVREQLDMNALRRRAGNGARSMHRGARLIARAWADRRRYRHALEAIALVCVLAGCGGGGSGAPTITVGAARTYALSGFTPTAAGDAVGKPTRVSFTILQPNGKPLTQYKHGAGPHNGVHLIIVRRDLATIIHLHPPVGPDGRISDDGHLPAPGPVPRRHRRVSEDDWADPELPGVHAT